MSEPVRYSGPTPSEGVVLNDAPDSGLPDAPDPVIELYKRNMARTILRGNLKLTPQQRSEKFLAFMQSIYQLQEISARERRR